MQELKTMISLSMSCNEGKFAHTRGAEWNWKRMPFSMNVVGMEL